MQLEAVKMNGHYFVPYFDKLGINKERIKFIIPDKNLKDITKEIKIDSKSIEIELTDEYIEKNWRELIMTSDDTSDYYKSEQYYKDRAKDYKDRGKG